ncbi:DUF6000 family protein [Mesonia aestuariivivens]|uniref:Uncharacterized protein n=1 Tax=Mesonia aestuariivivens TaxID=2796128 RepID=A0ABS6W416_9FLAO|nr:DUF6000 family protein [Mesonia aestuariivivens]MBW2962616.1 hypothetical protein [Mesonia aestuariivivens]
MDEKTKKQIELHSAGATVRHLSPFEELENYSNEKEITAEFIKKWCVPFYMFGINNSDEFIKNIKPIRAELNEEVVLKLLGDFNWRTRIVGAYFASILELKSVEEIIGIHLVKSQVCYAGNGYCLALATFNTQSGIEYLKQYLEYYLTRKDLHFDQTGVMCALKWTDEQNGTNEMENYLQLYNEWNSKPYGQNLDHSFKEFEKQMNNLKRIKTA